LSYIKYVVACIDVCGIAGVAEYFSACGLE
jgi:hypothetical protein